MNSLYDESGNSVLSLDHAPGLNGSCLAERHDLDRQTATSRIKRPNVLFVLGKENFELVYSPETRAEIERYGNVIGPALTRESVLQFPDLLAQAEVIFSGWESAIYDEKLLDVAVNLKAVLHGAGSIRSFVTERFWERGIVISSAAAANAVPVAEYTLAVILLSLKHFWRFTSLAKIGQGWGNQHRVMPGGYGSTVGLVSCGMIARKLLTLLEPFELRRLVYCPFLTQGEASRLNVELCSLEEVFRNSDIVSVHTPHLRETHEFITGAHIMLMREGATLINTARGEIINEPEMIEALKVRSDLTAVLDVTSPEPPLAGSPILQLPNVIVSPHIAGSHHHECRRMGAYMLEELKRYVSGQPLEWQITREMMMMMA